MVEHTLLKMFWQIVRNDQFTFDQALGPCMSTRIAMAMHIPVNLLDLIDHIGHRLDIFLFTWGDLLDSRIISDIFAVLEARRVVDTLIVDLHAVDKASVPYWNTGDQDGVPAQLYTSFMVLRGTKLVWNDLETI